MGTLPWSYSGVILWLPEKSTANGKLSNPQKMSGDFLGWGKSETYIGRISLPNHPLRMWCEVLTQMVHWCFILMFKAIFGKSTLGTTKWLLEKKIQIKFWFKKHLRDNSAVQKGYKQLNSIQRWKNSAVPPNTWWVYVRWASCQNKTAIQRLLHFGLKTNIFHKAQQVKAVSLEESTCKRTPEDMFKSAVMRKSCSK